MSISVCRENNEVVNMSGESGVNRDQCIMEKMKSCPHTVTIPPLNTCTTGTISDQQECQSMMAMDSGDDMGVSSSEWEMGV